MSEVTKNSLSLLKCFRLLEEKLRIGMKFEKLTPQQNDRQVFIADIEKAKAELAWKPIVTQKSRSDKMIGGIKNG
jgi:hypothetical protein